MHNRHMVPSEITLFSLFRASTWAGREQHLQGLCSPERNEVEQQDIVLHLKQPEVPEGEQLN